MNARSARCQVEHGIGTIRDADVKPPGRPARARGGAEETRRAAFYSLPAQPTSARPAHI
jgi:hypothetical protein